MEPKYSMTMYAVANVVAIGLLAARGFPGTAEGLALGVALLSAILELSYRVRREDERVFEHRRVLDRIVRRQWLAIGVVGGGIAVACDVADWAPLQHAADLVQALIFGCAVVAPAVYVSAAIDWWWIVPKISGTTGVTPCALAGSTQFEGTTKVWYAHRAAATLIVTVVLAGVPGYMASQTGTSGTGGAVYAVIGSLLAVGYNAVNTGLLVAFRYAFNPRFHVGHTIRVNSKEHGGSLRDAYVVDVSIAGLTYKESSALTDDGRPRFATKGVQMSTDTMAQTDPAENPRRFCPHHQQCRAINWYCFRHPNAHEPFVKEGDVVPVDADGSPLYAPAAGTPATHS
jgi:hypothetical protein